MEIRLVSFINQRTIHAEIYAPTREDVKRQIQEIVAGNATYLKMSIDSNIMFVMKSDDRWVVNYSGLTKHAFVNAILIDLRQTDTSEVLFYWGDIKDEFRRNEIVSKDWVTDVAIHYAETGELFAPDGSRWHFRDELPLEDD